jgi:outer membrane protein assembly factor BamA
VVTIILLIPSTVLSQGQPKQPDSLLAAAKIEAFPILSYDTDVGLGYGLKIFFLNQFRRYESFDVTAFNSTKGERWYRFVFSIPDFELRQGKAYPKAFDLIVDYDKYLKNNFFGIGNTSRSEDRETYTKEPLEIMGVLSRAFTPRLVGQMAIKYKTVLNTDYSASGLFANTLAPINRGRNSALSLVVSLRHDSRDSYVNAMRGHVVQAEVEVANKSIGSDYDFSSAAISLQLYKQVLAQKTVLAVRWIFQAVGGSDLPIHSLASLGGNRTLRGYPQDRLLDQVMMQTNAELRFPIYWRFGGLLFLDAGKVWSNVSQVDLQRWPANVGAGLRLYFDTFVVRADLGVSKESVGFYLNFGQIF